MLKISVGSEVRRALLVAIILRNSVSEIGVFSRSEKRLTELIEVCTLVAMSEQWTGSNDQSFYSTQRERVFDNQSRQVKLTGPRQPVRL